MLADKEIVHSLIPQAPPMIMVDQLIYQDDQKSITGLYIYKDNIFCQDDMFTEEGMIENMAQSLALRSGWKAMEAGKGEKIEPAIGVLGAVKNFKLNKHARSESHVTTEIMITAEIFNASMVHAKVMQDGEVLAEAELKIFVPENQTS